MNVVVVAPLAPVVGVPVVGMGGPAVQGVRPAVVAAAVQVLVVRPAAVAAAAVQVSAVVASVRALVLEEVEDPLLRHLPLALVPGVDRAVV